MKVCRRGEVEVVGICILVVNGPAVEEVVALSLLIIGAEDLLGQQC